MLVTFYSEAYENIVMFGHIAQHLLKLMGHSGAVPGAILAKDVPDALSRLQQGIENEKNPPSTPETGNNDDDEPPVSLAHRALPLINMLKAASTKQCNVMWK
ncbi:DUF1840 domain-containing protein [Legionella jamestowniensis]|uniref:DUF1840 domain-containing protein n=1 Tax=Legionella jamestowniensis TaxID=455 RepID=A0A0W0UGP0_9GAMM|nr:DUF1840 domain-containing protein [Legionella jamestowniensis]KTD07002.1 hypothetical protein Ljam_1197 [Legionella jamestowniensis]OCH96767.1 hypothetical protein A8135_06315 [Legionella jamestowniensis]SFM03907.1 protein of unknown function [Legionella jamestowniensis DSM 19215]